MTEEPETPTRRDWIAVERRVFDDPMFAHEPYSKRDAWLWLIAKAAKRDHHTRTRGGVIELKRSEVIVARDHLAKLWGWTPSRVRTFLDQLVAAGRIELRQSDGHHPTVATITKYELFQNADSGRSPVGRQWVASTFHESAENSGKYRQSDRQSANAEDARDTGLVGNSGGGASPVESPVDRQSVASGSPHTFKEQRTRDIKAERARPSATPDRGVLDRALTDFNRAAELLGFSRCTTLTDQRAKVLAKRLADLGGGDLSRGAERFRDALSAIPHDRFFAGKAPPRSGSKPFRLDLERLLSTGSGMGDVLAKLCDLHDEHGAANVGGTASARSESEILAEQWREAQAEEMAAQRARFEGGGDAVH